MPEYVVQDAVLSAQEGRYHRGDVVTLAGPAAERLVTLGAVIPKHAAEAVATSEPSDADDIPIGGGVDADDDVEVDTATPPKTGRAPGKAVASKNIKSG